MSAVSEKRQGPWFALSEANGDRSRDAITIAASQGDLLSGAVLGQVLTGTATADAGNTGDGTMGAITFGGDAVPGTYQLVITAASANAGDFTVFDPSGASVGSGTVGVAFTGSHLNFTLADGGADFVVGDSFEIAVAGGAYGPVDLTATDGTANAAGILGMPVNDGAAVQSAFALVRDCVVKDDLVYPSGYTADQIATVNAALAARGIIRK